MIRGSMELINKAQWNTLHLNGHVGGHRTIHYTIIFFTFDINCFFSNTPKNIK